MVKTKPSKPSKSKSSEPGSLPEFAETAENLVPLGDTGLWITPTEPVSPTDCDNWADSPYCGGNPFSEQLYGLNPEIVFDECNIGISLNPVLGFIKMPQFQLVYKDLNNPACIPPLPESVPPKENSKTLVFAPPGASYYLIVPISFISSTESKAYHEEQFQARKRNFSIQVLEIQYPYTGNHQILVKDYVYDYSYLVTPSVYIKYVVSYSFEYNQLFKQRQDSQTTIIRDKEFEQLSGTYEYYGDPRQNIYILPNTSFVTFILAGASKGTQAAMVVNPLEAPEVFNESLNINNPNTIVSDTLIYKVYTDIGFPLPSLPPPKPQCCMGCCPNTNQDDALLQTLLEKVEKLSQIVGVDEYPASLPESLISKDEGFIGNLIPNPNVEIPNLTRLLGWYVERFDEIMGQFEIPIQVKDADPTTPGDQPVGFKLSNMAESVAEMMGLLLQASINLEILVNMNTRTMVETGQDKQQNFKSYMLMQAIAEYLGFEQKDVIAKMPLSFNPAKDNLEEMLKETEMTVTVTDYNEKGNLRSNLVDLLQAAAIIRAVYWRKLDIKGNIKEQVINLIKGYGKVSDEIGGQKKDENNKDDFDRFTDDAEVGFTNTTGITDTVNPFGRNYSERPRIRQIGDSTID